MRDFKDQNLHCPQKQVVSCKRGNKNTRLGKISEYFEDPHEISFKVIRNALLYLFVAR